MLATYYLELDLFCIIVLVTLMIKTNSSCFTGNHKFYFRLVLLSGIGFCCTDLIWIFNNGYLLLPELLPRSGFVVSYVFNGLHMLCAVATGLTWLLFSDTVQGDYRVLRPKHRIILLTPAILTALLVATTGWTRFIFYLTEEGAFVRGPGYYIQVAVAYSYAAAAAVTSLVRARRAQTMEARKRSLTVASFVIPPIICGVLALFTDVTVLFIGSVVSMLSVFISLQELQIRTDPLTGLNNRALLDQKITAAIQSLSDGYDLYLLVLDVNDFKHINDEFGHLEGDRALTLVAEAIKRCPMSSSDFVCRYGGDEFVLLHRARRDDCSLLVASIHDTLSSWELPYSLDVSVGVCRYTPDMGGWQGLLAAADKEMYRIKQAHGREMPGLDLDLEP